MLNIDYTQKMHQIFWAIISGCVPASGVESPYPGTYYCSEIYNWTTDLLDRYLLIQDHRHGEIPGGLIWIEVERRSDTCITFCIQGASVSAIPGAMLTPRRCRATREEWILEFVIFLAFLYWACDPHEITCKRAERGHVSSLIARSRTYHSV